MQGKNGYIGPVATFSGACANCFFDPSYMDANATTTLPVRDVPRSGELDDWAEYWWFGKLGNGSQIANGNYTMRFAVLKPFGNPKHSDDWHVYKMPTITVLRK